MYIHKQCLHKRFAALPGYKDTLDMRKHVNSIYGLAFVPVADVLRTCEEPSYPSLPSGHWSCDNLL